MIQGRSSWCRGPDLLVRPFLWGWLLLLASNFLPAKRGVHPPHSVACGDTKECPRLKGVRFQFAVQGDSYRGGIDVDGLLPPLQEFRKERGTLPHAAQSSWFHVSMISSPHGTFHNFFPTPTGINPIRNKWVIWISSSRNLMIEGFSTYGGMND